MTQDGSDPDQAPESDQAGSGAEPTLFETFLNTIRFGRAVLWFIVVGTVMIFLQIFGIFDGSSEEPDSATDAGVPSVQTLDQTVPLLGEVIPEEGDLPQPAAQGDFNFPGGYTTYLITGEGRNTDGTQFSGVEEEWRWELSEIEYSSGDPRSGRIEVLSVRVVPLYVDPSDPSAAVTEYPELAINPYDAETARYTPVLFADGSEYPLEGLEDGDTFRAAGSISPVGIETITTAMGINVVVWHYVSYASARSVGCDGEGSVRLSEGEEHFYFDIRTGLKIRHTFLVTTLCNGVLSANSNNVAELVDTNIPLTQP